MKQRLRYIWAAGLVVPALIVVPVLAATNSTSTTSDTSSTNSTSSTSVNSSTSSTSTDSGKPVDLNAIKERITQEKTQLKLKLTTLQTQSLLAKCVPAQAIVKGESNHVEQGEPHRTQAYQELVDNLGKLIDKLKAANVDTTTLAQEKVTLAGKIANFQTALTDYKQSLSDAQAMDCKADPIGFKAALETARTKQQAVNAVAVDIRAYVTNTIKPTLVQIRTQLAAQSGSASPNSTTTSGGSQ